MSAPTLHPEPIPSPDDPTVATSPADDPSGLPAVPWRQVVRWAALGTLLMLMLVGMDVQRNGGGNPVSLIQPGGRGPAATLFHRDFPDLELPPSTGLDGQMYYAVARNPFDLHRAAQSLDRPRYRLQHPLLSWLGWGLHPTGGGDSLVWALFLVGVASLFIGGLATGALSATLRGPPWLAALFPLLPGAYWSLRVTVSDTLALGLALAAIALAARNRTALAVLAGVLAVLAKEPLVLVLLGWALARRTRRDTLVAVVPAAVAVAWALVLRVALPGAEATTTDLALPFTGLVHAWTSLWSHGRELVGMACTAIAFTIGIAALAVRRLDHPLSWIVVLQLAYLSVMGSNPLGVNFGATRMSLPLMVVGALVLLTPRGRPESAGAGAALSPGQAISSTP